MAGGVSERRASAGTSVLGQSLLTLTLMVSTPGALVRPREEVAGLAGERLARCCERREQSPWLLCDSAHTPPVRQRE
jgi:hypothetical protein